MPTPNSVSLSFDPYPQQAQVLNSDARYRVVAAGRRSGKTLMAAVETVRRALESDGDWTGYWVGAEHQHAQTAYRLISDALPEDVVEARNKSPPRTIELYNGATIEFHTSGGGALVSIGLDWVVCDEADKDFPEESWTQELRPALSDRGGDAMFISTPGRRGWFHDWYQRGQSEDYDSVASWQWSTYRNPHVPDSEVDAAREDIPDRIFRQEYMAEFPDEDGAVFRVGNAVASFDLPNGPEPHDAAEPPYRVAADLARAEDYLAIVGLGAGGRVSHLTRERGLTWREVQQRIEAAASAHDDATVAIDATRDNKLVADLEAAGVAIEPVTFTSQRKQTLVENLAAGIEDGDVTIPEDTMLATELSVFAYEVTRGGNIRYDAPQGHHDDTVDALCMAYDLPIRGGGSTTVRFGDDGEDFASTGSLDDAAMEISRRQQNKWK
jgi:hypothetical protein